MDSFLLLTPCPSPGPPPTPEFPGSAHQLANDVAVSSEFLWSRATALLCSWLVCSFHPWVSCLLVYQRRVYRYNKVEMFCRGHPPTSCRGQHFSVTEGGPAAGMGRAPRLPDWGLGPPRLKGCVGAHARRIGSSKVSSDTRQVRG